jgi:hypothetical protein
MVESAMERRHEARRRHLALRRRGDPEALEGGFRGALGRGPVLAGDQVAVDSGRLRTRSRGCLRVGLAASALAAPVPASVERFLAVNGRPIQNADPDVDVPMIERTAAGDATPTKSAPGSMRRTQT